MKIDRPKVFAGLRRQRFGRQLRAVHADVFVQSRRSDAEGAFVCVFVRLAEVTELFERNKIEDAIAALRDYSGGSTDYGQAFIDFKKNCLDDVDNRTTIIILGDARNNYGDPRTDILKEMCLTAQNDSSG